MKKIQKKIKLLILLIIIIVGGAGFCYFENNNIVVTKFEYKNSKVPQEFDNFSIVQISDLHNKEFGQDQKNLIDKVKGISPDIIVITGDLIDRRRYDLETAMEFVNQAVQIAPVYYVSGNHEAWSGKYEKIKEQLISVGVNVLEDDCTEINRGESIISLLGASDPDFLTSNYIDGTNLSNMVSTLEKWKDKDEFKILLSHRPELLDLYAANNMDMVFTGHAHGGQFRIPFVGGLVAPDQGLFPKYDSGEYVQDNTTMYVSRGLGNSIIPVRIFNRPEIIQVTLKIKNS